MENDILRYKLKCLIKKYWNAGMNNAYWHFIEDSVIKDVDKLVKKVDKAQQEMKK